MMKITSGTCAVALAGTVLFTSASGAFSLERPPKRLRIGMHAF
jgi:hypothetical protein